ncbi:Protein of unknown function [Cotesia congregata]|uniref:Uncharacterized protein n=1 Tax=Cotesia congregata TaxID=51543 RepID=A0A8J2HCE9_COTCN|nr:Protein of unknown function [Cotesia congregata]
MQTTTDLFQMCDKFGICYDVNFLNTLNKTKDNYSTEINATVKEIEEFSYTTDNCLDPIKVCVDNQCKCLHGMIQWNNKCYSSRGGFCLDSSHCLSTHLEYTFCWGNERTERSPNILCHAVLGYFSVAGVLVNHSDSTSHCRYAWNQPQDSNRFEFFKPNEKIVWKNSNIKLDNAIYGGPDYRSWYHLYLICQTEHNRIKYLGQLLKPNYNVCRFILNGTFHESKIFDVLVYDD